MNSLEISAHRRKRPQCPPSVRKNHHVLSFDFTDQMTEEAWEKISRPFPNLLTIISLNSALKKKKTHGLWPR